MRRKSWNCKQGNEGRGEREIAGFGLGTWGLIQRAIQSPIQWGSFGFHISVLFLLAACTGNAQSRQDLNSGKQAMDSGETDQAIRDADAVINSGDGPALAEAYYLRGYAIELRPKPDNAASARDLSMARDSYTHGLAQNPRPVIAARLHVQLGNVCYYQEDYSAAVPEFTAAYNLLEASQSKDIVLYRIGICEQRLGRFEDADRSFQRVQQEYPNSAYVSPARAHQGIRGFYVQIGAYSHPPDIDKASRAIVAIGSAPLKTTSKGLTIVRTADVPSYGQAEQLRARLAGQYPDARVMP
jgi:tetratricopeptide (TPR) repeat protein